jgi:hypothetical protein
MEDGGWKIEDGINDMIPDLPSSILHLPSSISRISVAPSLRYDFSRRNFDFNNAESLTGIGQLSYD